MIAAAVEAVFKRGLRRGGRQQHAEGLPSRLASIMVRTDPLPARESKYPTLTSTLTLTTLTLTTLTVNLTVTLFQTLTLSCAPVSKAMQLCSRLHHAQGEAP